MSTILVICPTHRDYRELKVLGEINNHRFLFHDYEDPGLESGAQYSEPGFEDSDAILDRIISKYPHEKIDGVASTDDYPGSMLASASGASGPASGFR